MKEVIVGICEEGGILIGSEGEERDRKLQDRERERRERRYIQTKRKICVLKLLQHRRKKNGGKRKNKILYIAGAL